MRYSWDWPPGSKSTQACPPPELDLQVENLADSSSSKFIWVWRTYDLHLGSKYFRVETSDQPEQELQKVKIYLSMTSSQDKWFRRCLFRLAEYMRSPKAPWIIKKIKKELIVKLFSVKNMILMRRNFKIKITLKALAVQIPFLNISEYVRQVRESTNLNMSKLYHFELKTNLMFWPYFRPFLSTA